MSVAVTFETVLHHNKAIILVRFKKNAGNDSRRQGQKDRYVPLLQSILTLLRSYYLVYKPKDYLFEGRGGGRYAIRSAQSVFKNALRKARINKQTGIHGLRHSYATHLLEYGTDISFIQQLFGS